MGRADCLESGHHAKAPRHSVFNCKPEGGNTLTIAGCGRVDEAVAEELKVFEGGAVAPVADFAEWVVTGLLGC